ncbi:MAG: hypothetical protein NTW32_12350 [Chloroflexi bacterium]|nr:hypothetical protein [Chloroflexota bacterium]
MKKLMSVKWAGNLLLISFGLLAIFDILILLNILPADIVWGGQIKDSATKLILETIALFVTIVFAMIVAAKINYIQVEKFKKAVNIGVWVIFAYLILNTVGNLASGVSFENLIFAPITVALAFFALRLAIEK